MKDTIKRKGDVSCHPHLPQVTIADQTIVTAKQFSPFASWLKTVIVLMSLLILAACGGETAVPEPTAAPVEPTTPAPEAVAEEVEESSAATATAPEAETAAFPVTIDHQFGSTVIEAPPERVVAIGYTEQDPLLALGIKPVAVRYWYGEAPHAIFPWAQDEAAGHAPEVLEMPFGELNLERILQLQPDLISAVSAGITAEEYELLSQIAPTIAQSGAYPNFGMPWQEMTKEIGQAVGQAEEAAALVDGLEEMTQTIIEDHPEFTETTIAVAYSYNSGTYGFFAPQDGRARFFTNLGFEMPAEFSELAGDSFYFDLSPERLDLLDQDLLIFLGTTQMADGPQQVLDDPLIQQLDAVKDGRYLFVPVDIDNAIQFSSVLSLEYALEGIVPELEAVIGGVRATAETADERSFPVTFDHKFGTTTLETEPERVITIGYSEQDAVLALGVTPVAIRDWFGEQPYGVWPWSQEALGDGQPELLQMPFGELNYELLTTLEPDLFIATHAGITAEEYELLSQIAPVLAQPAEYPDFGVPWQVQTEWIGRALGRSAAATELIAEVETAITAAKEAHEGFGGATVAWITPAADAGQFWVVGPNTPPLRFLTSLGLTYAADLAEVVGDLDSAQISSERLDLLDVDVLIVRVPSAAERELIENDPLLAQLSVFQDGRVIFFEGNDPVYGALSFSTVASLDYAVTELVPLIQKALAE